MYLRIKQNFQYSNECRAELMQPPFIFCGCLVLRFFYVIILVFFTIFMGLRRFQRDIIINLQR